MAAVCDGPTASRCPAAHRARSSRRAAISLRRVDRRLELPKLGESDGALQFGHSIVEGQEVVVGLGVAVAPGLVDEETHTPCEVVVVGDDQPALASRDVLSLLQTEAADRADRADRAARRRGEIRLRAVLDHRQAVPLGQRHDLGHLAGIAEQVRDHDCLRAIAEAGRDRVGR